MLFDFPKCPKIGQLYPPEAGPGESQHLWNGKVWQQVAINFATSAGATDLGYTAATRLLTSSTGADVTLPLATTTQPGLLSAADQAKVNAVVLLAQLRRARKVYVSLEGNDLNNGTSEAEPLRTLRAAALAAEPGDVVLVDPGTFTEILPIRWKYDVTVFGSGLRSTIVQPAAGQEFNDIFKVDSGFWCWGISFASHQADSVFQSWAIDFDELADNTVRGAVGPGAFILKSPYIQNCTSITAEDDAGTAGSASTGNTGGGIRVDGSKCALNSPIRSMVVDSYTQVNLGGPGCLVLNDGYAQLVSFFGTFCTYHVRTETGGQVNLSGGGTTDFGTYGLMADGYSPKPLYTGSARIANYGAVRLEKTVTIDTATDLFGCVAHGLLTGDQVTFKANQGSLPTGLAANTTYFVISSGLTVDAFKVSATAGGTALDMSGAATGTYQFVRQGVTELDVISFSANRLGRQIKYPSAGSLGSPGNSVQITARGGSTAGSTFTVTLATSTIGHEYVGGGAVTVGGVSYPVTSASYNKTTGVTVLTATGYAPTIGASVTLAGLSFICDSASRPNAGQLMFPQLVFPRNASTGAAEAKTFAYTRTGNYTLTYAEAASASGPEHEYVSGGTATISGTDYGVANAVYNKTTGVVTLTTRVQLPAGNGNITVNGLVFICPTSGYIVTSSIPINAGGTPVANTDPTRAGYRVVFYSGVNGGLKDAVAAGQKMDFRNRSQISAPSHTFEYVGSGLNYDALPWNGGIGIPENAIVETNNGRVYSSNTNEKGDFKVGTQFSVDGTTGSVTINTDEFNLSGLNFIGPFSRNGGISSVGVQLREISNNTTLTASTGGPDGNTAPTQFAVKSYAEDKFLQNVTVTAGLPLTITDTSSQDGQGYWTRQRNIALSLNVANGLLRLDSNGLVSASLFPATAVTAGTYGSASAVAQFTVDATGRITASASVNISIAASAVSGLATVATSGAYSSLSGLPTLGTSSSLNVAATGNATTGQVVKGDDTRLSDPRTPTAHNQAWSTITGTPTTLSGYGIIDGFTETQVRSTPLTGFTSGAGTISATDSVLAAIQKLNGNVAAAAAGSVTAVTGTTPIVSSGGATPVLSITAATTSAAGSMSSADKSRIDALATSGTPQFAALGLGVAPAPGFELTLGGSTIQLVSTVTAASGVYTLDVTAANEFVTAAAIAGATTINLSNLTSLPAGYRWRGVLSFAYTSGVVSWFTGNTGYTVKWDGGTAPTLTASDLETVVITVTGGVPVIEVTAQQGRA